MRRPGTEMSSSKRRAMGADPNDALRRVAETRGLGCPQTLEQRMFVLAWEAGR